MSMINKEIDDFTVQAFHNDDFETVTKDDVLGKWGVFFFYPADFTFVCPTELEDLGALYDKFQEANCEIYAVSCDTHFAHKAWHDASENIKKLPYPMLACSLPTGSMPGWSTAEPGPQRAGHTESPCSATNWLACTRRSSSAALRPMLPAFTS